jgi:hypothetical protein
VADNYTANAGSGGQVFASDDIGGGVQVPRVKETWGPDGTMNDVSLVTPLPVQLINSRTAARRFRLLSAASTNATSLKGSAGVLFAIYAINLNAAIRYLKFYNKASAPTVGSDTPVLTLPIPASATGAGFRVRARHRDWPSATGIAYATTTGVGDADSTRSPRTKSSSTARTSKRVAYGGLRTFGAPVAIDAVQRGVGWRGLTGTAALDRHAARQRHPQDDPGARPATFALTGNAPTSSAAASWLRGRQLRVTGNAATLTKSLLATTSTAAPLPSMSMNFAVDPTHKFVLGSTGTFNVTGVAMVFRTGHGLVCDSGSFLVQGAPALRDFEYVGAKGSFAHRQPDSDDPHPAGVCRRHRRVLGQRTQCRARLPAAGAQHHLPRRSPSSR